MPKAKKLITGILSIDPSWRGCGWAIWIPETNKELAGCSDIVKEFSNKKKLYDTPDASRDLVYKFLCWLFAEHKEARICNVVVLERQFKKKMQNLYHCFSNQLRCLLGSECKIVGIAAWNTKEFYGTSTGTYRGNKKEAIAFLVRSPQLISASLHLNNDNTADAIILLNHLVDKHYSHLMSYRTATRVMTARKQQPQYEEPQEDLTGDGWPCDECKQECMKAISQSEKNFNRVYWKCGNKAGCSKPENGGFVCWEGEEGKPKKKPGFSNALPPAKRQRPNVVASNDLPTSEISPEQRKINSVVVKYLKEIYDTVAEINNTLTMNDEATRHPHTPIDSNE